MVTGNEIINNNVAFYGGGVRLQSSSAATVTKNMIALNTAGYSDGGGIHAEESSATISNNQIRNNMANVSGGGINLRYCSPLVANNVIAGNRALSASALSMYNASPKIVNNTIVGNHTSGGYGTVRLNISSPTIANTIIAFNSSGISVYSGTPVLRFNCVYGNTAYDYSGLDDPTGIDGNIGVDPLLADPHYLNLHLQPDSPCIDAGDDAEALPGTTDMDGQPRLIGAVDIGADESDGTAWVPGPNVIVRVSPDGDDASDGSAWDRGKRTVQAAIDAAALAGGEVWVAAGTYAERVTLAPYVYLFGGFAGDETQRGQRDWVANVTVLDGAKSGSVVTARLIAPGVSAVDGFTITNGSGTQSGSFANGGGVYLHQASPAVVNSVVAGNRASYGAGIYVGYESDPQISDNTIEGNYAEYYGAGVYAFDSRAVIANNTFSDNTARYGGGLYVSSSPLLIRNNLFVGNVARITGGGGLYVSGEASPVIAGNIIVGNRAAQDGGGMRVWDSSPTIANNTITGNVAPAGGGLNIRGESFPTIVNTIVAFNSSGIDGPGASGGVTLSHNCVYGNAAYDYSGLADPTGTDGNINVDPGLAGAGYGNLHLQPGSPCVDAGDNGGVQPDWVDMDGQPRQMGAAVDIGADEADGTTWPAGPNVIVRVSPAGDDANDGSSWTLAKRTVQAAVDAAGQAGGDVWVAAGTYVGQVTLRPYAHLFGGFAGHETSRGQRDRQANVTVLDGDAAGSVVTAEGIAPGASTIDGFTITNGSGTMVERSRCGGGMLLLNAYLAVSNNTITGNTAGLGGGLFMNVSQPVVTRNTIVGNSAGSGGGLYLDGSAGRIADNTVGGNAASMGGGLYLWKSAPSIVDSTITRNTATARGGGFYMGGSDPMIVGNKITGNVADDDGGAMYLHQASPTIADNVLAGNRAADDGGALYLSYASPAIVNSTIAGNAAADDGGVVCIGLGSSPTIANTMIALNTSGVYRVGTSGAPVLRYSCVYGNAAYDFANLADPTGTDGNISVDPMFVRLPDDGGDGWGDDPATPDVDEGANDDYGDLRLLGGSPCIDAGDNAAVPADAADLDGDGDTAEPLPLDLAGGPRFVDHPMVVDTGAGEPPVVDIGAYEFLPGDVDGDGRVNVIDLLHVVHSFNKSEGEAGYERLCDFNGDGIVNVIDLLLMVRNFGRS